jgi:hypothetical protein
MNIDHEVDVETVIHQVSTARFWMVKTEESKVGRGVDFNNLFNS